MAAAVRRQNESCLVLSLTSDLASSIVAFWLGPSLDGPEAALARKDWWYRGGEAVDEEIGTRFGELVPRACVGAFNEWDSTETGSLALVILLDQFTRNLYRNTPDAYIGDLSAFEIVEKTIDQKLDHELHPVERIWLYHPFHHAEDIQQQDRGLTLLHELEHAAEKVWQPYIRRAIAKAGPTTAISLPDSAAFRTAMRCSVESTRRESASFCQRMAKALGKDANKKRRRLCLPQIDPYLMLPTQP